ncbi:MAG: hypothetical protein ACR2MP_25900 [Streptosporangiaceae bacterium]
MDAADAGRPSHMARPAGSARQPAIEAGRRLLIGHGQQAAMRRHQGDARP